MTPEVAQELKNATIESWIPLGRILLDLELITIAELSVVLEAQERERDALFGDLVVELGVVTQAELELALIEQTARSRHAVLVALDDPRLVPEQLLLALSRYVSRLEQRRR